MARIRKHLCGQKGFTLIELLVVVAILGILAGIAIPRVMDAINSARDRKALADMTVIRDALERFYLEYAIYPASLDYLVAEGYIDPNFTFKNSYGYTYFYAVRYDAAGDADNFSDYVLGDPGNTPAASYTDAGTSLPEGLYNATNHTAYQWGAVGDQTIAAPGVTYTSVMDTSKSVSITCVLTALRAAPTDNVPKPTSTLIAYTGQ